LFIHLTSGKVLESIGSLDGLSKQLEQYDYFFRPHRSYLINLDYVQNLSHQSITMSCLAQIPLPRGKYHEVKDAYLKHMCQSGQKML
jgi:DNA-binding LytR/AlgR family response regulator